MCTKQSIGFIGPGVSLLCLNYANTPTATAVLLTAALCLSYFSQAGFLLNIQCWSRTKCSHIWGTD
ncbi:putative phosphate-transporting ATPase [Rosa chinensis]|uniref:Putative phosphate-transporting ATPase n=1 Tax=Rosa chinensis TaxID=74649 RepID=A0A2P6QBB1_ROSCH|nr:putative phosphate-transporting ATPase [Rosa chinensis]